LVSAQKLLFQVQGAVRHQLARKNCRKHNAMTLKILRLASTALIASISAASATTITQTVVQPTLNTDWTTDFTLNNFNTSLGTLTSITATLADNWSTSGTVKNTATGPNSFFFTETTVVSEAGGPPQLGNLLNTFDGNSVHYVKLASGASAPYGPFSKNLTSTYNSAPADLTSFEAPGTFTINLATNSGTTFTGGGGNTSAALTTNADATFTLVYTYTTPTGPVGVAEPTSLALLGTAMVGIAGFVRRRA